MKNNSRYMMRLGQVVVAGVMSGFGVYAAANEFSISSGATQNQFTLSNGSGFSTTATVNSSGVVTTINNVPLTSSFGIPNFAFTLSNTGATSTTYTFEVGVSIAEVGTNRRLEAYIATLDLEVNGSTVTGSIPTQDLTVLARAGSLNATTTLNNTNPNGPYAISGGGISFSGANLVNGLLPDSLFENILGEFNTGSNTYDYNIVIEQTASTNGTAPAAKFGIVDAGFQSFTAATPPTSVFELNSGQLQAFFGANSYRVSGQFTTTAASSGGGGGTGGGGTGSGDETTDNNVNGLETAVDAINTALQGPAGASAAAEQLNQVATNLGTIATQVQNGSATLSAAQVTTIRSSTQTALNSTTAILNAAVQSNNTAALDSAISGTRDLLNNLKNAQIPATDEFIASVQTIAVAAVNAIVRASLGADATEEDVAAALNSNESLFDDVINRALPVPPSVVELQTEVAARVQANLPASVNTSVATKLAQIITGNLLSPDSYRVGGSSLQDLLTTLFGGGANSLVISDLRNGTVMAATTAQVSITTDDVSGVTKITLPGESYAGMISSVKAVSSAVSSGIRIRRNGTALIVTNGVAIELSPISLDLVDFTVAVEAAGYDFDLRNSGALAIDLGSGNRFAGVFAYDNLTGQDLSSCGTLTIIDPTLAPTDPMYSFGVNCSTGIQQRIVPYVDNVNFFASLDAAQIPYSVDRNTGIITSEGNGRFKPSFFVSPLTAAETEFHTANKDANGVAFQAMDINGDGRIDFKVIAPNGTQVLYGVE